MTVIFDNTGIADVELEFVNGVAAIDMFTLNRAGHGVASLEFDIQLPEVSDVVLPNTFSNLCVIKIEPGPKVTATIDTQKMRWDAERNAATRSEFTDYTGCERYGVKFKQNRVIVVDDLWLTVAFTKLDDGSHLLMWFAEVSEEQLNALGYYELYEFAARLSARTVEQRFDDTFIAPWVCVPAQQIKWERSMDEIVVVNQPEVKEVWQRVYLTLDETGVRVKASTKVNRSAARSVDPAAKPHIFGAQHPVVMWLTEPGFAQPFAVTATKSEAWLNPDRTVSFDETAFTHGG